MKISNIFAIKTPHLYAVQYGNEEFNVTETIIDSVLCIKSEIIPNKPEKSVSRIMNFLITDKK